MPYDAKAELKKVRDYYAGDPLQKRFSAIICGNTGVGKTYLLRTCRLPIHIDSFDPGGTKCLRKEIEEGWVVADTQWENEDPFSPKTFAAWMTSVETRMQIGYFKDFGSYAIDSATKWMDAAMNYQLNLSNRQAEAPRWSSDYVPTKVFMVNYISKLMNLPCDFILNGHFREIEDIISIDTKTGITRKNIEYRFLTIGQAAVTIPLMFDEIYVLLATDTASGLKRELLLESQGKYLARSRLKAGGKLNAREPADIKSLLKKIGLDWKDKPKLTID